MVLPIKQDDIYMGLAEINGLIRAGGETLEIEYKVKDDVFGMFDSKIKSCHIPLHMIDSIEVEPKWLSGRFHIFLNRLPDLDTAFRLNENCLTFKFKKKELEKAKSFRSMLMLEISEQKLKDLDDEMKDLSKNEEPESGIDSGQRKQSERAGFDKRANDYSGGLKNMLRDK